MPVKKQSETTLQVTEENSHAVISIGDGEAEIVRKVDREDDGKPLYLKRI